VRRIVAGGAILAQRVREAETRFLDAARAMEAAGADRAFVGDALGRAEARAAARAWSEAAAHLAALLRP
jgi:alkanesulfonate monooxygenase SsuD/methylene tetrahydromethanopterin reductase-like flavin-dependent oxidoreductase (luciferase family)